MILQINSQSQPSLCSNPFFRRNKTVRVHIRGRSIGTQRQRSDSAMGIATCNRASTILLMGTEKIPHASDLPFIHTTVRCPRCRCFKRIMLFKWKKSMLARTSFFIVLRPIHHGGRRENDIARLMLRPWLFPVVLNRFSKITSCRIFVSYLVHSRVLHLALYCMTNRGNGEKSYTSSYWV